MYVLVLPTNGCSFMASSVDDSILLTIDLRGMFSLCILLWKERTASENILLHFMLNSIGCALPITPRKLSKVI